MIDYTIIIEPISEEDGGGYLATVRELPGCMSDGETRIEAVANIEAAISAWLSTAREMGWIAGAEAASPVHA